MGGTCRRLSLRRSPHFRLLLLQPVPRPNILVVARSRLVRHSRLYDGTVLADYYRAIGQVEILPNDIESGKTSSITPVKLIALVDALSNNPLTETQQNAWSKLREAVLAITTFNTNI
jgi:hypothetical protein